MSMLKPGLTGENQVCSTSISEEGVGLITLQDSPAWAQPSACLDQVIAKVQELDRDKKVLVIIIAGMKTVPSAPIQVSAIERFKAVRKILITVVDSPLPSLATDFALSTDIIVAGDHASLTTAEVRHALQPGYLGKAYEHLQEYSVKILQSLDGRESISGEEAINYSIAFRIPKSQKPTTPLEDAYTLANFVCIYGAQATKLTRQTLFSPYRYTPGSKL